MSGAAALRSDALSWQADRRRRTHWVDPLPKRGGVCLVDKVRGIDFDKTRIAKVEVSVMISPPHRLHEEMSAGGRVKPELGNWIAFQDIERLAQHHAA